MSGQVLAISLDFDERAKLAQLDGGWFPYRQIEKAEHGWRYKRSEDGRGYA